MSFAYKLWKIGQVLTDDDLWNAMLDSGDHSGESDLQYINIDFTLSGDTIDCIDLKKSSISSDRLFFTKKIGGTSNSYYLYPNLNLQKSLVKDKIQLLVNTLKYGMLNYVGDHNRKTVESVLSEIEGIKKYIDRAESEMVLSDLIKHRDRLNEEATRCDGGKNDKEIVKAEKDIRKAGKKVQASIAALETWNKQLLKICSELVVQPKGEYWIWLSINGETFYELMPEIKENWFREPVFSSDLKKGFDAFTNIETDIGYKPEVRVFSYDQYHDSMNYRLNENLPLSLESARKIKFAWMYIINNLVFYFKGLEYVVIPNILSDDAGLYKTVLERFRRANVKSNHKKSVLEQHNAQEKKLEKDIEKIKKKINEKNKKEWVELEQQRKDLLEIIDQMDTGLIKEFNEQIEEIGDLKNSITIDYLFTKIDRTNLSFEIKGSLEDVVPSRIQVVVSEMNRPEHLISDRVKLGKRHRDETLLQDYFNRKELAFVLNRSQLNNANTILQEKLYLARLLLTDTKINLDSLMARFEENRLYGYDMKKRLNKEGTYLWIEHTSWFTGQEDTVFNFLKRLDKIKG
ncbi:MAG: TM1802 family CRISPR-associated protein [Proteobacteria bacterium]|nr:TM1802 family CRISPR-associated protein [Pseudomonadota bacterium]